MVFQRVLIGLLVVALGLPILLCVLFAVGGLLRAMGDAAGAGAIRGICLALYILWAVDLIGLVIAQALHTLAGREEPPDVGSDE